MFGPVQLCGKPPFGLVDPEGLWVESRPVEVLTLSPRWLREQRDENEAQQAEAQSDWELHPDTSRQEDTTHLRQTERERRETEEKTAEERRRNGDERREERGTVDKRIVGEGAARGREGEGKQGCEWGTGKNAKMERWRTEGQKKGRKTGFKQWERKKILCMQFYKDVRFCWDTGEL